jgi:hypothetical protein
MFQPEPTATVLSGGMDGDTPKRHAYWALVDPLPAADIPRHALRLARYLDADEASTDAARIARVPGSRSHKTGRVAVVERFTGEVHALDELTGDLEDAPRPARAAYAADDERLVPVGRRRDALKRFLGLLRSMGFGERQLVAFVDPFLDTCVELDEARVPLDREHARRTAEDIARRYPPGFNR